VISRILRRFSLLLLMFSLLILVDNGLVYSKFIHFDGGERSETMTIRFLMTRSVRPKIHDIVLRIGFGAMFCIRTCLICS